MNTELTSILWAEKRDGKSLSGSLRMRSGGIARPTVSRVHLRLSLQLGPLLTTLACEEGIGD